jgi:regulator of sigma E protease
MDWMIMVAQLLLSLSFLVAVHEMGHLLAAKYFGMRVEQFSIGFPPKIWSFRKGETEYAISAIPLGGYVKISGMIDESLDTETMKQEPQSWEFRSKPAWQRLIVMLGGIIVNVVVGIMIFIGITFVYGDENVVKDEVNKRGGFRVGKVGEKIGLKTGDKIIKINGQDYQYVEELSDPATLLTGGSGSYTVDRNGEIINLTIPINFVQNFNSKENASQFVGMRFEPVIGEISKKSIAEEAKLQAGDVLIEVNGQPVAFQDEVTAVIAKDSARNDVSYKVRRGAEVLSFDNLKFKEMEDAPCILDRRIGFLAQVPEDYAEKATHSTYYGFGESIPLGTKRAFTTLFSQIKAFGLIITGKIDWSESVSGPIGIVKAFDKTWNWQKWWALTGVLSLVLAFMNLLPIPALDGGHVVFLTYEIISSRKPSDKFLEVAQKVGMVFLLVLMVLVLGNDIVKIVRSFFEGPSC